MRYGRIMAIAIILMILLNNGGTSYSITTQEPPNTLIVSIEIDKDGTAHISASGRFYGNRFIFALPYDAEIEDFTLNLQKFEGTQVSKICELLHEGEFVVLNCMTDYPENVFSIEYKTKYYVSLYSNEINFLFSLPNRMNFSTLDLRVLFPPGYILAAEKNAGPLIFPHTDQIYLSGSRYTVLWEIEKAEDRHTIEAFASLKSESNFDILKLAIPFIVIIAVLVSYLWSIQFKRHSKNTEEFGYLLEDERKIVELLKRKGDYVKQKDIVNLTGFSKAKISRLLRNLEARGIIKRMERGRSCYVKLRHDGE